jgi:hypothetical protein
MEKRKRQGEKGHAYLFDGRLHRQNRSDNKGIEE